MSFSLSKYRKSTSQLSDALLKFTLVPDTVNTYHTGTSNTFTSTTSLTSLPLLTSDEAWIVSMAVHGSGSGYITPTVNNMGGSVSYAVEGAAWWDQPIGSRIAIINGPTSSGTMTMTIADNRVLILSATRVSGIANSANQVAAAAGYSGDATGMPTATLPGAALTGSTGIIIANFCSGPNQGAPQVETGWTILSGDTVFGAFGLDMYVAWRYSNGDNTAQHQTNTTQQVITIAEFAVS